MNFGFLITARLKSTRLKYKVLKDLNGYSVIERVIQRAKKVQGCNDIVLCTSHLSQDLPLVRSAIENDIYYYNGSPEDVLQRLLEASELFQMDYVIGITADNPMFSLHHANLIVDTFKKNIDLDYIYTSGMPVGVNIYGMKTKALRTVCNIKEEIDTEIWGYLINRPEIFNVKELIADEKFQRENYRMTLDEASDYQFFQKLYAMFSKDEMIDVLDAYRCLEKNPDIATINSMVIQKDLDESVKKRISKFFEDNKKAILDLKKSVYSQ